jgi:hypothetical protein
MHSTTQWVGVVFVLFVLACALGSWLGSLR